MNRLAAYQGQLTREQRFRIAKARSRRLLAKLSRSGGASAHTEWMDECVPEMMDIGKDQTVAIAACLNMWRDAWEESHPDGAVDPGPGLPDDDESGTEKAARGRLRQARLFR